MGTAFLDATHEYSHRFSGASCREAFLVQKKVVHGRIPQDSKIRLLGRRLQATDGRASQTVLCPFLCHSMAALLDGAHKASCSGRSRRSRPYAKRNRNTLFTQTLQTKIAACLSNGKTSADCDRLSRWVSQPKKRPAPWSYRHVARMAAARLYDRTL